LACSEFDNLSKIEPTVRPVATPPKPPAMAPIVAAAGASVNDQPNVYGAARNINPAPAAAPPAAPAPIPLETPIIFPLLVSSSIKRLCKNISDSFSIVIAPSTSFCSNASSAT